MIRMKPEVKKKWVDALRSGKYRQGKNELVQDYSKLDGGESAKYCCLGVLCCISGLKPMVSGDSCGFTLPSNGLFETAVVGISADGPVEYKIPHLDTLRLHWDDGTAIRDRGDCETSLSHLNDIGFTFSQIADIIERFF